MGVKRIVAEELVERSTVARLSQPASFFVTGLLIVALEKLAPPLHVFVYKS